MKKLLIITTIFLISLISQLNLFSQNISINVDIDNLYSGECGDQWGTPDYRYYNKLYVNGSDAANWNPSWDDHSNCNWIGENNLSFYDNSNISPYTYINLNYRAFEEDDPWTDDGVCSGYESANGNITVRDYSAGSWHYFTDYRNCCGGDHCIEWGVQYSFYWNYVTVNTPSAPTVSNDNSCNPTLNAVSSTQSYVTWYWQTSPTGTSTANVSTNPPAVPVGTTTFYLRARGDLNGVWSAASSVTVTRKSESITATSISGSSTICTGDATTLTVVGGFLGTGANWRWYANSCGGTLVGTGLSISVNPAATTTYYVRAEGDCNTTSCVSLTVTVGSNPQSITTTTVSGLSVSTNPSPYGASLGESGGLTLTYTNASWPACSNFGVTTTLAAANLNNLAAPNGACSFNNLTYDAFNAETNLANGKVCFTGTQSYYCINTSGTWSTKSVSVRLRMIVTKIDGTTPKPLSHVNSYITSQANENFIVKVYIEANVSTLDNCRWAGTNYYTSGGWHGVVDVFDALHTDPNRSVCTGFDYNWYNITSNTTSALASTNLICPGSDVGLVGNSTMGNCYTQVWTGPNGFSTTTDNPTVTNFQSANLGTYQLLITDNRSCFGMSTLAISDLYSDGDWVGNAMDGNWHTSSNWCGGIPTVSDDANILTEALSMPVVLDQNADVCGITIEPGSSLTIANDRNLNIYCSFYNYGDFFAGSGSESVTIKGNNCNVLSGGDNFNNFVIDGAAASAIMNDNFNIKKNFLINDGQINTSTYTITFNGSDQQDIKTNSQTLNSVIFNNTSADNLGIILTDNLTASSNATFTSGIVKAGTNKLILLNGATFNVGNLNSFLDGEIQVSESGSFTLPLGDYINRDLGNGNTNYKIWAPINIISSNLTTVNASYHFSNDVMPDWWSHGGNMDATLHHVSDREYWLVSADQNLDKVTLYWNDNAHADGDICTHGLDYGFAAEYAPTDLSVAYWSGTAWRDAGGTAIGDHDNGSITSSLSVPLGAKSQTFITLASKENINPLPVELTSFSCNCNNDNVEIVWQTASEINNHFFVIQKSDDLINFEDIKQISGNGNSNSIINYQYTDNNTHSGTTYYRLKQVDFDGTTSYSDIVSTNCFNEAHEPKIIVYPNPFNNDLNITTEGISEITKIEIIDGLGKMVYAKEIVISDNTDFIQLSNINKIAPGTYCLKIITETNVFTKIIVKQ
ncbi:MAG: T9SS type A sorting domain-containing protein [Bacteroidales bacterium]|nr:T9SS type A sorting domain-containing protein [Bacteroidales bacterium]